MNRNTSFSRRIVGLSVALGLGLAPTVGAERPMVVPEVSVSVRAVSKGTIEVGESVRVAVRVDSPDEWKTTIELAPAQGSWADATRVEMVSAGTGAIVAIARPAGITAERRTILDQEREATGLWWFPADALTSLTPGDYFVRAKLAIRDGDGWKGESASELMRLRVIAPSNSPERVTQRALSRAHAAILEGAFADAAGILDAVLQPDPDNVPVLRLRAALCLHGGDFSSAYLCVNRARTLSARVGGHPSIELQELALRIERAAGDNTRSVGLETWAMPPRSVLDPVRPAVAIAGEKANATPAAKVTLKAETTTSPTSEVVIAAKTVPSPAPVANVNPPQAPSVGTVLPSSELSDTKILANRAGQWAVTAAAGSQYGRAQYSASQATGVPNVRVVGNSPDAWCPAARNVGMDWLEVTFANPARATEVRVRQSDASGAIAKVEAIEPDGTAHVWWEGTDPYKAPEIREIVWFAVRVPTTAYLVARVKLTLNLASGPGYKQIDAVQLVAVVTGK